MTLPPPTPTIVVVEGLSLSLTAALAQCAPVVTVPLSEALRHARQRTPDLLVAPLAGPEYDGVSLCAEVRRDASLQRTAVLLVSAPEGAIHFVRALEAGADACLVQPDSAVLQAQARALLRRCALDRQVQALHQDLESRAMRTEGELRAVYRNAHQLEAIGRLAGGVAHNFNNLLTVVLMSSELLIAQLREGSAE